MTWKQVKNLFLFCFSSRWLEESVTLEAPSAVVSLVSFRNESLSRREADVHLCDTMWRWLLCDPGYYWLWRVHSDCVSCFCVQFVSRPQTSSRNKRLSQFGLDRMLTSTPVQHLGDDLDPGSWLDLKDWQQHHIHIGVTFSLSELQTDWLSCLFTSLELRVCLSSSPHCLYLPVYLYLWLACQPCCLPGYPSVSIGSLTHLSVSLHTCPQEGPASSLTR